MVGSDGSIELGGLFYIGADFFINTTFFSVKMF
jgi:hypothetical protein